MKSELIIRKHSALIQVVSKNLSLIQRKLINAIVWIVQYDEDATQYEMSLASLKKITSNTAIDNDNLKKLFKALEETELIFNYLSKDRTDVWETGRFLSWVKIGEKKGYVIFEMAKGLKDKIRFPSIYAPLNMKLIAGFKSSYTIILYEMLRDYVNADKFPTLSIQQYRDLMGIDKGDYKLFNSFKISVLDVAVKELNNKSDLHCEYTLDKEGTKKYQSINFKVWRKPKDYNII